MAETTKRYIGDSVYAEIVDGMIRLTTENGFGPSNEIFLELEVFQDLILYAKKFWTQTTVWEKTE